MGKESLGIHKRGTMWEVWLAKLAKYWDYWDESAKLDDLLDFFWNHGYIFEVCFTMSYLFLSSDVLHFHHFSPISPDLSSRPVSCPCLFTFHWVAALRFLSSAQWPARAWRSCQRSTGIAGCAAQWTWHRRCSAPGRCSESWWCWRWDPIQCCTRPWRRECPLEMAMLEHVGPLGCWIFGDGGLFWGLICCHNLRITHKMKETPAQKCIILCLGTSRWESWPAHDWKEIARLSFGRWARKMIEALFQTQ